MARALGAAPHSLVEGVWVPTDEVGDGRPLARFDGVWCVPGVPYRSVAGALAAIRYARQSRVPFLGTSAGFQYALIEYARDVLGMADADHEKTNPRCATPLIAPLGCALAGVKARVRFAAGSIIRRAYGKAESMEEYHCSFGLNGRYRRLIEGHHLVVSAVDDQDEVRGVELDDHPFFAATLFQPEMQAPNPLINAFVAACARQRSGTAQAAS